MTEIRTRFGIVKRIQMAELPSSLRTLFSFRKLMFTDDENAAKIDIREWKFLSNTKVKQKQPVRSVAFLRNIF